MSFQDVKRRQHPIFDSHRYSSSGAQSASRSSQPSQRPNPSHVTPVDRREGPSSRRPKSSNVPQHRQSQPVRSHHTSVPPLEGKNQRHRPPRKQDRDWQQEPEIRSSLVKEISKRKSVRPRLTTTCPVTQKKLLQQEDASVFTHPEDTRSVDTSSFSDEQSAQLPRRVSTSAAKSQSVFAHLTKNIVNFQKLVAELEGQLRMAGSSPEAQWRSRILIQSAKDVSRDIQLQLDKLDQQQHRGPKVTALRKLHRDFDRVQEHLRESLQHHERQQKAEIAFLSCQANEEDFFDKAMRERDAEVQKMHSSMNQVNEIYQDLAALVEDQQDQIDHLDEVTDEAKATTRDGLKQVQATIFGMCAGEGQVDEDVQRGLDAQKPRQGESGEEGYRVGENFDWNMPFETLGKDFQAVQIDVMKFGEGLWDDLQDSVVEGRLSGCANTLVECHPGEPDDSTAESMVETQATKERKHRSRSTSKRRSSNGRKRR